MALRDRSVYKQLRSLPIPSPRRRKWKIKVEQLSAQIRLKLLAKGLRPVVPATSSRFCFPNARARLGISGGAVSKSKVKCALNTPEPYQQPLDLSRTTAPTSAMFRRSETVLLLRRSEDMTRSKSSQMTSSC